VVAGVVHESEAQAACTGAYYWHHWDAQGGTSVPSSYLYQGECGGTLPNPLPSTTRSGYTFTGWYSSSGAQKVAGGGASNAHITFYAGWAENLSISYLSNGGTMTSGGSTSTYVGGTISTLPTVSKTGYTFNGWFQSWGGTQITTSSPHGRTADFMLVASWTANTLNISYYSNGGTTPSGGDSTTTTGGRISSLPTTSRTGYTFNGWYLGGTQITAGAAHGQTADFMLVASWTANTLNITYSAGGGTTPSGGDSTTTTGGRISSLPTTSRTGYTFNGWYTAPSGGTRITTLSETHGQTDDFTLYAQWTANTLNITYNANGGTTPSGGDSTTSTGGTVSSLATTSRTGYTFAGWYTASSGGTRITTSSPHSQTGDFTLYAQWTANTLNITYNAMGGTTPSGGASTTTTGGTISSLPTTSKTGYTFAGWYTASSGGTRITTSSPHGRTSNFTLYAQWSINWYTFSFDPNGGGNTPVGSTRYYGQSISGTCFITSRTGYSLAGWKSSFDNVTYGSSCSSGTGRTLTGFTMPASNVVFTAQWTADTLTITYNSQSGSAITDGDSTTTTGGSITTLPTDPTRSGYTFAGWYTASSGGTQITAGGAHGQTGNFTLYAQWSLIPVYTLTYDANGGSGSPPSGATAANGVGVTVASHSALSRPGYTFAAWNTSSSRTGSSYSSGDTLTMGAANVTLYAQWTLNTLTITYDSQGGSVVTDGDTTTLTTGGIYPLPTPPTRTGYTFAGWNSAADGTGTDFGAWIGPGQEVAHGQTSDFTLYAQWTGNTLTITYDENGGDATPSGGDNTTTYGGTISTLATTTRTGYTFAGWYTATSGGTQITANAAHGQTADFTLHAQWSLIPVYTLTYDANGGSGSPPSGATAANGVGVTVASHSALSRPGYTFAAWNTAASGTGTGHSSGDTLTMGAANVTLYAQWTADTLTITYDSQSGSPITDGDSATTTGGSITALPTDPTRSGYTFNGWFTATSGGSQITTSNPHGQISDFTLFAQWTQIPVQVAPTAPSVIAPAPPPSSFTIDMGDGSWCLVEHSNERIATDMSVPVGARFSVHGTQFQPDSDIEIWLNSTRVLFGTATAGIDNTFVLTSNLPDQIEPGEHTLGIVGINLAGDLQTTWIGLLVYDLDRVETPDLELPITGRNDAVVLNWSLALLVAGLLVGVLSRRRELLR
jgi:uncharacterized repeat protein (TIGR02543 family)